MGLNGKPCRVCGEPTKTSNRTGVHARCMGKVYAAATPGYRPCEDVDSFLSAAVHDETDLLPWERHPEPWDCVRIVNQHQNQLQHQNQP